MVYGLLMKAAAETTLEIAADPKHLGARIGFTAVLHSWGSAMTHHPHVHMIVPGGGLSEDGASWVSARPDFLVHVNVSLNTPPSAVGAFSSRGRPSYALLALTFWAQQRRVRVRLRLRSQGRSPRSGGWLPGD